jgi:hypothetical protein
MENETMNYFGDGSFDFMDDYMAPYLVNAHWAITQCELWDWLRTYSPHDGKGFMFSTIPEMKRINTKMNEQDIARDHSGASYGGTMRVMECIAKNGYEKFKEDYLHS